MSTIDSPRTETDAVIEATRLSLEPRALDLAQRLHLVADGDGEVRVIDVEDYLDRHRDRPRRKAGTFRFNDAPSLLAYLKKHGEDETEVWADLERHIITAVLNAHTSSSISNSPEDTAGHGDHRALFTVAEAESWKRWIAQDGKLLDQATFAELIEDGAADIARPTSADMLELAQTFQATIGVDFQSSERLSSGERQLKYREQVDAKAGRAGQLEIPEDFDLALAPFEGADPYRVRARFRYRINEGNLRIGYRLDRPDLIVRNAFLDVVKTVEDGCDHPVFRGTTA